MAKYRFNISIIICLIFLLFLLSCSEKFPDNPIPNKPPETFISIFSTNELNPTISKQTIHWWGDDPDGVTIGSQSSGQCPGPVATDNIRVGDDHHLAGFLALHPPSQQLHPAAATRPSDYIKAEV